MRPSAIVLLLAWLAAPAAAEPVTVSGAPAADRDAIVGAIEQARTLMAPCWRRKPPATVTVALSVAASGEVVKATAKTRGAAAQCAAGLLAVATLPATAKPWKGTVALASASEDKSRDLVAVNDRLASHRDAFFACQQKAPAFAGKVKLRVTVRQDGAISAVRSDVVEGGKDGQAVAGCVAVAARAIKFDAIGQESLNYDLTIPFPGGGAGASGSGGGGSAAAPVGTDPSLQPSKKGPLDDDEVTGALRPRLGALAKCTKGRAARGKVTVRVAIAASGKATAKIKSSEIGDTTIEGCLLKVLQATTFRAASGETVLIVPLRLDADGLKSGI